MWTATILRIMSLPIKNPGKITYQPYLPKEGQYNVCGWWVENAKAATNVPLTIEYKGSKKMKFNQQQTGDGCVPLYNYKFNAGRKGRVAFTNINADGIMETDAVKFEWIK